MQPKMRITSGCRLYQTEVALNALSQAIKQLQQSQATSNEPNDKYELMALRQEDIEQQQKDWTIELDQVHEVHGVNFRYLPNSQALYGHES